MDISGTLLHREIRTALLRIAFVELTGVGRSLSDLCRGGARDGEGILLAEVAHLTHVVPELRDIVDTADALTRMASTGLLQKTGQSQGEAIRRDAGRHIEPGRPIQVVGLPATR